LQNTNQGIAVSNRWAALGCTCKMLFNSIYDIGSNPSSRFSLQVNPCVVVEIPCGKSSLCRFPTWDEDFHGNY